MLLWHEWAPSMALGMLVVVFALAGLQFLVVGSGGVMARWLNSGSLRTGLIVAFALIATVPTAALGVLLAERSANQRHDRMADFLERNADAVAREVDHVLGKYLAGVSSAASSASSAENLDAPTLSEILLLHHEIYSSFLTMLAADADGNILTATSNMTGFLEAVPDARLRNVRDRSYFREPMASGEPFISEVFQGRGLGQDVIVAISAPLTDETGKPVGVVEGSLNLKMFDRMQQDHTYLRGTSFVIVDSENRVISSSADFGFAPLDSIADETLITSAPREQGVVSYDFTSDTDYGPSRYLGATVTTANGWRVYAKVPLAQIAQQMQSDYVTSMLLIFVACVLALMAASAIVKRVTRTVDDMNTAISQFRADGSGEDIRTPATTPSEFRPIFRQMRKRARNLRRAQQRLSKSIRAGDNLRSELTQAVARKEVEIAERTAALEEANERLDDLSRTDPLTGAPNRREFDDFRQRIWRACARSQSPASIILLDIDFFKIYNDSLGHQAGDDCLVVVAQALIQCANRPLDLVARYGGEEFAVVLGEARLENALVVAERMRNAVVELAIQHPGSSHDVVTVSAGVAATVPKADDDCDSLLKAADEALYYAKAAGRNCVVYPAGGQYVTYSEDQQDLSTTNVIAILSGKNRGQ